MRESCHNSAGLLKLQQATFIETSLCGFIEAISAAVEGGEESLTTTALPYLVDFRRVRIFSDPAQL